MRQHLVFCWILLVCLPRGFCQPPSIPPNYQDLYTELQQSIGNFNNTVLRSWDGSKGPTLFGAHLDSANANTKTLADPAHYAMVMRELDALKAIGMRAVMLSIGFPRLYPGFYANPADYQACLDFYTRLAADIRARGMKLIVESTYMLPTDPVVAAYLASLTFDQYQNGRAQQEITIAQQMRPDYLSLLNEPDFEASNTGQPVGTPDSAAAMLTFMLNALRQAGVQGIPFGAGAGNWNPVVQRYIESFAQTTVDYIDIHTYTPNGVDLMKLFPLADTAASFGKPVAMTECWLDKFRDSERGGVVPLPVVEARDAYSFFIPLDAFYLQALVNYSHYRRLLFMTPFWSWYFAAYMEYDPAFDTLPPPVVLNMELRVAQQAFLNGEFTPVASAYQAMILPAPDTAAPTAPGNLSAQSSTITSIPLAWSGSTDNIGVGGYRIFRNNIQVGTSGLTSFTDTGLIPGKTYSYRVAAYDVAGNQSTPSAAASGSTLPDTTPPSVPQNLTGTAVSATEIDLAWSASTDDAGVYGYQIYRNGVGIANATGTQYQDTKVTRGKTYTYTVTAYDVSGNVSARSAPVSVTP